MSEANQGPNAATPGDERLPTAREVQQPIGGQSGTEGTWLSGDEEDDELREDAAERARQAVDRDRARE